MLDAYITKEANDPHALRPDVIAAKKYYTPLPPLPLKTLAQSVQTEIDTIKYFNAIKKLIAYSKQQKASRAVSLDINDALAEMEPGGRDDDAVFSGTISKKFKVQNNQYEIARL